MPRRTKLQLIETSKSKNHTFFASLEFFIAQLRSLDLLLAFLGSECFILAFLL